MSIEKLKTNLHKQIEALDDEGALQLLHEAAVEYNTPGKKDILDILTTEQKSRLETSLQQAVEGNTVSHKEAMEMISKWRNK
jgi:hypothetical protein